MMRDLKIEFGTPTVLFPAKELVIATIFTVVVLTAVLVTV